MFYFINPQLTLISYFLPLAFLFCQFFFFLTYMYLFFIFFSLIFKHCKKQGFFVLIFYKHWGILNREQWQKANRSMHTPVCTQGVPASNWHGLACRRIHILTHVAWTSLCNSAGLISELVPSTLFKGKTDGWQSLNELQLPCELFSCVPDSLLHDCSLLTQHALYMAWFYIFFWLVFCSASSLGIQSPYCWIQDLPHGLHLAGIQTVDHGSPWSIWLKFH